MIESLLYMNNIFNSEYLVQMFYFLIYIIHLLIKLDIQEKVHLMCSFDEQIHFT
jgi:hypothetical protein